MKCTKCSIGLLLVEKIKSSNISLAKIAEHSEVNSHTIENWLYGEAMPSIDKAEMVLKALGYVIEIKKISGEDV